MDIIFTFDVYADDFQYGVLDSNYGYISSATEQFCIAFESACHLFYDKLPNLNGIIKIYFDDFNGLPWGVPIESRYEPSEHDFLNLEAKVLFDGKWNLVQDLFDLKESVAMRHHKKGKIKLSYHDLKRIRVKVPYLD